MCFIDIYNAAAQAFVNPSDKNPGAEIGQFWAS